MLMKNKKAEEQPAYEEIIFLILNLVFFGLLLFFVIRTASGDAVTEERYAKAIALAIDNMQPATEMRISLNKLIERADKNKISNDPVNVILNDNVVLVKISRGGGYSFKYYTLIKEASLSQDKKILTIKT